MVYEKKDGLDPNQYVDVLRALHITTAVMTDAILSLAKMEIIQPQDAVKSAYNIMNIMDKIAQDKKFVVVDGDETFTITIRR